MKVKRLLLAALGVSVLISLVSPRFNPYYLDILLGIGINIILAVGLNLINGYTGQFSLGHAGFMAIGAYVSAYLSTEYSAGFFHALGGANFFSVAALFLGVLIAGGLSAAVCGLFVCLPSFGLQSG